LENKEFRIASEKLFFLRLVATIPTILHQHPNHPAPPPFPVLKILSHSADILVMLFSELRHSRFEAYRLEGASKIASGVWSAPGVFFRVVVLGRAGWIWLILL